MTQFLNVIVHGSNSTRVRILIENLIQGKGSISRPWYRNGIKMYTVKDAIPEVFLRFGLLDDLDLVEHLVGEELDMTNSAILVLDATEEEVREKTEDRVNLLRSNGTMKEIMVLIINAAPRKNDKGILSRRQAKYFITGLDNDFEVALQYHELKGDPTDKDEGAVWEFVENTVANYISH